jgi:glyoxylase-like metal-dependent hydrolase (beta-lactamase superfamily II)
LLSRLIPDFATLVAPNPGPMTLGGTNTYVVGRDLAYVVDPGPDDAGHLEAVRAEGEARGGIAGAVLTHGHADHSAGVPALGVPLLWGEVSEGDESAALAGAAPARTDADRAHPSSADRSGSRVGPLEVVPTPGHARDHVVFVWAEVCFCGDLILGEGSSIVPPAAYGGSLVDYMESLRRVRALDVAVLAPGHGPLIEDPKAKVDEYIAHREEREARLVAALDAGERSRERLLGAAWDDVPEILRPAAAMAMQAHLEKLEAEGRLVASELMP